MTHYNYLIVGAGMTADAAVQGIRELDPAGSIALIGEDFNPPYNRPPLTKDLWKGKSVDTVWRKTKDRSADLFLGRSAASIDPQKKTVLDDRGDSLFLRQTAFGKRRESPQIAIRGRGYPLLPHAG